VFAQYLAYRSRLNLIIFILTTETNHRRGLGRLVYALKLADRLIDGSKKTRSTINLSPVTPGPLVMESTKSASVAGSASNTKGATEVSRHLAACCLLDSVRATIRSAIVHRLRGFYTRRAYSPSSPNEIALSISEVHSAI